MIVYQSKNFSHPLVSSFSTQVSLTLPSEGTIPKWSIDLIYPDAQLKVKSPTPSIYVQQFDPENPRFPISKVSKTEPESLLSPNWE